MISEEYGFPIRTLQDLESLIGTYETIRVEFKDSRLFYPDGEAPAKKDVYAPKLSKEISGLANTEGGYIVVGMRTEKTRGEPDKATGLDDGLLFTEFSPDRLQRQLDACISPPLHGLRCFPIASSQNPQRYYLVIAVPRSPTVHQAQDHFYYGRSEVETKPLHDTFIRALINRAEHARAGVKMAEIKVEENGGDFNVSFALYLENEGEIDIRESKVLVGIRNVPEQLHAYAEAEETKRLLSSEGGIYRYPAVGTPSGSASARPSVSASPSTCLFPKDRWLIGRFAFRARWAEASLSTMQYRLKSTNEFVNSAPDLDDSQKARLMRQLQPHMGAPVNDEFALDWTVYLSNTMPNNGSIDLLGFVARQPKEKTDSGDDH